MGAATVADAEEHGVAVVDELRQRARISGAARHDVAVQRGRQVGDRSGVERYPEQAGVADGCALGADGQQRRPVRGPGDGGTDAVGQPDRPGYGRRVVDVHRVQRGPEGQVRVGGGGRDERQPVSLRRPGRVTGVPVAAGELPAPSGGDVDDVQVSASAAQQAGAVTLVVEPVRDDRGAVVRAVAPVVDGGHERDGRAVGAPDRAAGAERQFGQRFGLATGGREQPHLRVPVPGAQERDPVALRRPGRCGVRRPGGQPPRRAARRVDVPQRAHRTVGVGVRAAQYVDDPGAVRRQGRLLRYGDGGQVSDAQAAGHRLLLGS
ncbi:hypothetical protein [Plantactinospora sp. BC1]|uniref:hypothetical protein n=1 Tax=Plantactinospora sp. BC1 TaxID=2108470 RepID=UPI001F1EC297|nr:hypothetical protein [Plantactinospora sp. BC1]